MEKETLFKEYEQWCVKNNKDPLNEETVVEFKNYKEQEDAKKLSVDKAKEKEELTNKQELIFKMICDYVGVKTKYDANYMFETLDSCFRAIALASVLYNKENEVSKIVDKVLN